MTLLGALVVLAFDVPRTRANWCWEAPTQTTHAEDLNPTTPGAAGATGGILAFGRADSIRFHNVVFAWEDTSANGSIWGHSLSFYRNVDDDLDWQEAWENRESLNEGQLHGLDIVHTQAIVEVVDRFDAVHTLQEAGTNHLDTIYRQRGDESWSGDPVVVSTCNGSPSIFLREGDPDDTLHVSYGTYDPFDRCGVQTCGWPPTYPSWLRYNWAPLADATDPEAWSHESWVTGDIGLAGILVDGFGVVHFIQVLNYGVPHGPRTIRVVHYYGTPPSSPVDSCTAEWPGLVKDTVDVSQGTPTEPEPEAVASAILTPADERGGEKIWIAWRRLDSDIRECYLQSFDTETHEKSDSVRVSPGDGRHSNSPVITYVDGIMHLMYQEEGDDPNGPPLVLYHRYNRGNPLTVSDWSIPVNVTWAHEKSAQYPSYVAVANPDTVWMTYQSHDDEGPTEDLNWEGWFQRGYDAGTTVAEGDTATWSGQLSLDRDFLVAPGGVLRIEAGTRIIAEADTDVANVGRDPDRIELIVRGTLQVNGEAEDRVTFQSTDGEEGDWAGLLFDLSAAQSGYGYGCASYISYTDVKDAEKGIAIRQTGAPSLLDLAFSDIVDDQHVVLDSSDVYVPHEGFWNLTAPTRVTAAMATREGAEIGGRNPGKVDLIVHGELNTYGEGSWVKFEPIAVPSQSTSGDEWGGIFFDWMSGTSILAEADVGYAITPISLYYQGARIEDSRIHHFGDRAVWMRSSRSPGPEMLRCSVFRDSTGTAELDVLAGNDGIVIEDVLDAAITESEIRLQGMSSNSSGAAISVVNSGGKFGFCGGTAAQAETLLVAGNTLIGPGGDADTDTTWSGIRGNWLCGAGIRKVIVEENVIEGWNAAGIDLLQSAEAQFTCNRVESCAKAVEFSRNTDPPGSAVRFRENGLEIGDYVDPSDQQVIRTDDAVNAEFGLMSARGLNNIIADGADWFAYENDEGSADTLQAVYDHWNRNGTTYTLPLQIRQHISKDSWVSDAKRVRPDSAQGSASSCSANLERARRGALHLEARGPEEPSAAPLLQGIPTETVLALPAPSPSRGRVEVRFDLAGAERRHVTVEVFDVSGRRLKGLVNEDLPGGRYGLTWKGETDGGRKVGAGVYFVRLKAGSVTQVRKAVLLR